MNINRVHRSDVEQETLVRAEEFTSKILRILQNLNEHDDENRRILFSSLTNACSAYMDYIAKSEDEFHMLNKTFIFALKENQKMYDKRRN